MLYGKLSNFSILEALQNFNFLIGYTVFLNVTWKHF